jgi:ATP-dependent HslUV protease subunit HslV
MTTIAYRDGILATDSLIQSGGTRVGTTQKVFKSKNGTLLAFAGNAHLAADIQHWIDKGLSDDATPDTDGTGTIVIVKPDGTFWTLDGGAAAPYPLEAPFFAEGSGQEVALGAMAMGANAVQAVEVAIHFDTGSGAPVQYVELGNVIEFPKKK